MALTMSDEQEAQDRFTNPLSHEANAIWFARKRAHAELDATRAQLAATQAERDEARAAMKALLDDVVARHPDAAGGNFWCPYMRAMHALLARPVGSVEALRALLRKAWAEGERWLATSNPMNTYLPQPEQCDAWIARLLEPADAARGMEGEDK